MNNTPDLDEENKRYADNIMDIFTSANTELVKEQIKEPAMCNAVNELFADQIKEKDLIIADKDLQLADAKSQLAAKDAIIAQLNAKLEKIAKKE